ncbi:MAG TPA: winged helix DNA-binding domain-containing protein [Gemmatimonadaceae bacterium]|nr:winged helix DNA-binding domain-containing protein [Gemmatimonadaceae bacterium]
MPGKLAAGDVAKRRLQNQLISKTRFDEPADVVRWFGAVQAQDYLAALWGVGLRTRSADERAIEQAIAARQIVRTWPMRGTLHFVAPNDIHWMLELLTPRVVRATRARHRQLELDDKVFAQSERVLVRQLEGGRQVTRPALYEALDAARIATKESRGLHIIGHLAQKGIICFGPRAGKQATLVLLDEWIPNATRLHRDAAIVELTQRYFTSHGPATMQDFAWWSGLTLAEIRLGLEGAASHLVHETIGDRTYWLAAGSSRREARASAARAHLLPAFDEYTVAYSDRSAVLHPKYAKRVNAGGGIFNPIVVVDGQVLATWKRSIEKDKVVISVMTFDRLSIRQRQAVDRAARRYAKFLGLDAEIA